MRAFTGRDSDNLPLDEKIRRFYDAGSPYYLDVFGWHIHDGYYLTGGETRQEAQESLIKLLAEKAGIQPGDRVLDVGCGIGGSSIWLSKNLGARTTGVTISPVQIEIARSLARQEKVDSTFLLMDADNLDFAETFDVIWVLAALTHFKDQEGFLKASSRFLTPGGRLVIYDWMAAEGVKNTPDAEMEAVLEGLVLSQLYPARTYLKWLLKSGYRIVYFEDITGRTIRTWDGIAAVLRRPGTWQMVFRLTRKEWKEIFTFLKGARAIKRAMQKGKIRSAAVVAEKV